MSVGTIFLAAYLLEVAVNSFTPIFPSLVVGITALVAGIALIVAGLSTGPWWGKN